MVSVWQGVHALEQAALASPSPHRLGCLLGLAATLASMCQEGRPDTKAHVASMHEQLMVAVEMADPGDQIYDVSESSLMYMMITW